MLHFLDFSWLEAHPSLKTAVTSVTLQILHVVSRAKLQVHAILSVNSLQQLNILHVYLSDVPSLGISKFKLQVGRGIFLHRIHSVNYLHQLNVPPSLHGYLSDVPSLSVSEAELQVGRGHREDDLQDSGVSLLHGHGERRVPLLVPRVPVDSLPGTEDLHTAGLAFEDGVEKSSPALLIAEVEIHTRCLAQ